MQCQGLGKITPIEYTTYQWGNDRYGGRLWDVDFMGLRLVPSYLKMDRLSFSSFAGGSNTAAYFDIKSLLRFFFFPSFFFPSTSHTYFIVHIQILSLALLFLYLFISWCFDFAFFLLLVGIGFQAFFLFFRLYFFYFNFSLRQSTRNINDTSILNSVSFFFLFFLWVVI